MSQQPTLQRSKSAPYTVSALGEPPRSNEVDEEKPVLARTVSHEHVHSRRLQRQQQQPKLKPLWQPTSPPVDEEDPFNLLTFYPPAGGLSRSRSGWQSWLRGEEAVSEDEEENGIVVVGDEDDGIEESPTIFTPVEDHEALKGKAVVGIGMPCRRRWTAALAVST
ncbi:hypothetical protein BKA70DRAFT_314305 [Coprinopsis sp. MPI-PUGE-AT-0042]|nr:hypothetical protein BKA70DRAFT_314305 [Coprinopsis sp. MPI-PUGE-AT-0042]